MVSVRVSRRRAASLLTSPYIWLLSYNAVFLNYRPIFVYLARGIETNHIAKVIRICGIMKFFKHIFTQLSKIFNHDC